MVASIIPTGSYRSWSVNLSKPRNEPIVGARGRRSKLQIEELKAWVHAVCQANAPLTVRQAFYRLVVLLVIPKTQKEYKNTVIRLIGDMHEAGELPWEWIVDNTRVIRKPTTYSDLSQCLLNMQHFYRKDIWASQDEYVEVWCESESAAGVLAPITEKWDVPLLPARGFSSRTFCRVTAGHLAASNKRATLYYFGDHDPSGVMIDPDIVRKLKRYGAGSFRFKRVAVTRSQIDEWGLPGTPPKKTDSRAKSFTGNAVELEAIPPAQLRDLCEDCITSHLDEGALERCRLTEQAERDTLQLLPDFLRENGMAG